MASHPVRKYGHRADLLLCYLLIWRAKITLLNVFRWTWLINHLLNLHHCHTHGPRPACISSGGVGYDQSLPTCISSGGVGYDQSLPVCISSGGVRYDQSLPACISSGGVMYDQSLPGCISSGAVGMINHFLGALVRGLWVWSIISCVH